MKKFIFPVYFIFLFLIAGATAAQETATTGVNLHGYVQTDNRALIQNENDEPEYSWQEYRLDLQAEAKPTDTSRFYGEFWIRSLGTPDIGTSNDLGNRDKVDPVRIDFREAYVDIYGFLFSNLDIRAGRQRIAWGTGDKINPTDNLNPDDMEDLLDFGRHLGSDSIKASLYFGNFTIVGVFIPVFTPAVLPSGDMASMTAPSVEGLDEILVMMPTVTGININDVVTLPDGTPRKSSKTGVKISVSDLSGFSMSASYVYGRDDLPVMSGVALAVDNIFNPTTLNVDVDMFYPNMNIVGLDLAGSIRDIGIWAEGAMFISEDVTIITDMTGINPMLPIEKTVVLEHDKPYYKYLIGMDYTFKTNTYVNIQHLHGFAHERGIDNLENYFMIGIEQKLFNEKLKLVPVAGAVEIKDWKKYKENYAFVYSPSISIYPVDSAEITIGANMIDGKDTTTFGQLKDNDEFYLKIKYNF